VRPGVDLSGKPFVDPPEALAEMGSDPDAVAREHHRLHWEAFAALREHIQRVRPDAILLIGDDQAQAFLPNNMPPYAIYVGAEVDATPFHATRMPGDAEYVKRTWGVDPTHTYHWPCHAPAATLLRDGLIERGFDIASSDDLNSAHWKHGLPHAHANTQLFLRNDLDRIPIIPLFVNCYGPDLAIFDPEARKDPSRLAAYPKAPSSRRLYAMGERSRRSSRPRPTASWCVRARPGRTPGSRRGTTGCAWTPRAISRSCARSSAAKARCCATTTAPRSRPTATTSCATGSSVRGRWARASWR
jgi:hypothetical protein